MELLQRASSDVLYIARPTPALGSSQLKFPLLASIVRGPHKLIQHQPYPTLMKFHIPSFRRNKPDSTPKDLNHTEETFIAHVPDDVLYRIFCLVIVDAYQSYPSHTLKRTRKRHGGDSMPTITISHVCSYWRKLALESPILWTLIEVNPYSHPAMLDAFLIRSRTAPLVIRFHDPAASLRARPPQTDHLLDHAETLSPHADRFVGFDLKLSTGNAERVLSCFKSPCTHLQQLLLFSPHGVLHQYPFAATLPSLRVVRIKGLRVPWLRYTSLTKLILSGQFALPFKDLLWTLQHCPELEVLSLILLDPEAENRIAAKEGVTLPPSNVPFSDVTSRIELPRLRNLSTNWAGAQPDMFFVVGFLEFPATAVVNVTFEGRRVTPFLFILCSRFWSMVVAQLDMARLDMESYNGYNRVSLCFHSKDGVSTMRWNFDAGHIEMALAVLEGVDLAILSLPSLRSLSIFAGGSMPLLKRHWLFLLRGIEPTVVVDVSVDGSDAGASALLSALRQGYEADSDAQAGDVLCPQLKRVTFSANLWDSPQTVLGDVLATFRARTACDVRLPALQIWCTKRFRSPKPPKAIVAQLKDVVGTVTFDLLPKHTGPKHYADLLPDARWHELA